MGQLSENVIASGVCIMDTIRTVKQGNHSIKIISPSSHNIAITDSDAEMDARAQEAVKVAIAKAKFCKKPVAKYDIKSKTAYVEYPDGSRVYI